ncbi:MAG: acetyl-CoA acetyltransferase [Phenylobacterium zucineum]|nr:MAG: acetyl-CoA acetyltransferase [Phenylobacterium zucineum]
MPQISDRTPILIGVGQAAERPTDAGYRALSPADLAGEAARAAIADAGAGVSLAGSIDILAAIRQFEISTPGAKPPFGASNNFPRSVAKRIGADPRRAILEITGGQGPQRLVGEFCAAIAQGQAETVLLVGSEAMSTVLHLQAKGEVPDWSETVAGDLEDRGYGLEGMFTASLIKHRIRGAIPCYALFENARRGRLGKTREAYAQDMGELFAPFSEIAARNPFSAAPTARSASELIAITERNRIVADPFTRMLVARDQVNQAAAILLSSVGAARAMGVPEDRWVYLHGQGDANELTPMERPDLSASPQSVASARLALSLAGKSVAEIDLFDFYSCFPIAVFNMLDGLGLQPDDPRGLTLTGGLPYFGGAGNDYSMHAIAEMITSLRAHPGQFGLIGANGGMLSKYATGIYSTVPADWSQPELRRGKVADAPVPGLEIDAASGAGQVETYTILPQRDGDVVVVIGRLNDNHRRFAALAEVDDLATLADSKSRDPLGRMITVRTDDQGLNRFSYAD